MILFVIVVVMIVFASVGFGLGVLWSFSHMDEYEHQMAEKIEKGLTNGRV